jgi:hypothetical protein
MNRWISALLSLLLLAVSSQSQADDALLKPFVLAARSAGAVASTAAAVETMLTGAGFTLAGKYSPYPDAMVLVVTSDALKANAAGSAMGGFGAIQRVAVTKVGNEVQVSYTNPVYMANAYRMKGSLEDVSGKLKAALGRVEEFGAKGLNAAELRKYHYMFGMEYFTDPTELASYASHDQAIAAVEKGLGATPGVTRVYRVDVPGTAESVFGVGMKGAGEQKYRDDRYIMSEIDFKDLRSTAHLPYEMLVSGNKVYALYARFRIAIDFPDLAMVGSHSFVNIMKTPDAIADTLKQVATGG